MVITDIYISLVIGTLITLLFVEVTGILPSGLIVPGYLALVLENPILLLVILLISLATYLIVSQGISRITILYGKRKFAAMITVAILLKIIFDFFYGNIYSGIVEISAIGVVVPGLIANTIQKQGLIPTMLSTMLMTGMTFLGIISCNLFI